MNHSLMRHPMKTYELIVWQEKSVVLWRPQVDLCWIVLDVLFEII